MTDYAAVLTRLYPDLQWTLNDNDYQQLVILDGGAKPSKKSLDDSWPAVKAEIDGEQKAKQDARVSGLSKLSALGLTDTEISALLA